MAKLYGLFGAMTGKVADVVMTVRNGVQIARKYQPVVFNPSSPAQIESRAKLKLISQLSAVMAPYIAIKREGNVSSRNLFVKDNYGKSSYANGTAEIDLNGLQLTRSVVGLPAVTASREGQLFSIGLEASEVATGLSRVVYVVFTKQSDAKLRFYSSSVVSEAGVGNRFGTTAPLTNESIVIYAYGVRDNTSSASVTFGNLQALTAEQVAKLVVESRLTESDITLTETRAITMPSTAVHLNISSDLFSSSKHKTKSKE